MAVVVVAFSAYRAVQAAAPLSAIASLDIESKGKADFVVFRPAERAWYVLQSPAYNSAFRITSSSATAATDTVLPLLDYNGDGKIDAAVWRPTDQGPSAAVGTWTIQLGPTFTSAFAVRWGVATDTPLPFDWNGDGIVDLGVWKQASKTLYVLVGPNFTTAFSITWGTANDIVIPGDYDGDGRIDMAVFRPAESRLYVLQGGSNFTTAFAVSFPAKFYDGNTILLPGDYDGDGRLDLAGYTPTTLGSADQAGTWTIYQGGTNFTTAFSVKWGVAGDTPLVGDFDGDGRIDITVWHPADQKFYVLQNGTGGTYTTAFSVTWGADGDTIFGIRNPVAPTTIGSFTASPTSVTRGSSSTLSWSGITNATNCSIDNGVGNISCANGNTSVTPTTTTTYTLTATGAGGSATATASVTVTASIGSFTASPTSVTRGSSSTLSWSGITNATSCSIDNGVGNISCANGNTSVTPTTTTTYTLTATGAGRSATATASVTVNPGTQTLSYTGAQQTFTVPSAVTSITVEAYGAQGGNGGTSNSGGGLGGYVNGTISVSPGETLYVYVGGQGGTGTGGGSGSGGFNGGAAGGSGTLAGGGGGGSDVRQGSNGISNRVIVAGAGAGAGAAGSALTGGAGGSLTGQDGASSASANGGKGGTQSAGGAGGTGNTSNGTAGTLGNGGSGGAAGNGSGGGGGGGYYGGGGGGGGAAGGGGGGGSSFAVSTAVNITHTQGNRSGNGVVIITY